MEKILIIEDDLALLSTLVENLEESGFEVVKAIDGEQGFSSAISNKPDLILLDILLPKLNGYDVLKKLREDESGKNIPVIVLTNLNSTPDVSKALETMPEIKGYIIKSEWKIDDIIKKVKEVVASEKHK